MNKPIILTKDNIAGYLSGIFLFKKGNIAVTNVIETVEYTNSGYIFGISLKGSTYKTLYLKQTRDKTKNNFELPAQRVQWESKSAQKFNKVVGAKIAPEIIYVDTVNNVLFMEDVLRGGARCVDLFKQGNLRPDLGARCGKIFGTLHGKTYGMKKHNFGSNDYWYGLLTDFLFNNFYLVGFKKVFGKDAAKKIFNESMHATHSFCHLDPLIKNIFFHKHAVRIVDFEQSTKFDPAYDVGSFLTPWALALSSKRIKKDAYAFIDRFFIAYRKAMRTCGIDQDALNGIGRRGLRYTITDALHHTQGKDVYDFFKPYVKIAKKEAVNLMNNRQSEFAKTARALYGFAGKYIL